MSTRPAGKAGSWYRGDPAGLAAEVDACVRQAKSRGGPFPAGKPLAAVVPHAGLAYSGAVAAAAFNWLVQTAGPIGTFVVFGACHRMALRTPAVWARGAWETPLGAVEIDAELADRLLAAGVGEADERPHLDDNAIELQLPFIRRLFPATRLVPIAMPFLPDAHRFGELAARTAAASGKTIIALASSDLTHYGAAFGLMPAGSGDPALAWTRENDRRFLAPLLALDLAAIVPAAERDSSACGAGAAAAAAGWAKVLGCRKGWLLTHTNSHEAASSGGRAEHIVGYAAAAFAAGDAD